MAAGRECCLYEALNLARYGFQLWWRDLQRRDVITSCLRCFLLQGGHSRRHQKCVRPFSDTQQRTKESASLRRPLSVSAGSELSLRSCATSAMTACFPLDALCKPARHMQSYLMVKT